MKKRLLFVEDSQPLLEMYGMMMEGQPEWEVSTAEDGKYALDMMEKAPFDVVVSDMHMPRMDGIQLLHVMRDRYPQTSRIIVSGISDQEEVASLLDSTHQFLAKPFDLKVLMATLARLGGLDAYLKDEKLKALVGKLNTLPSFPTLYVEIMKELGSEDPSIETVAEIIAKDPGMTAKILQIVNSAAVGISRKVSNSFEAVQLLGFGTVRSLALSAHIFSRFEHTALKGFSIEKLWSHGMKTAAIARMIVRTGHAEPADVDDANIAGMLHDIGKLMLAESMPEKFQQSIALAEERNIHPHEAELEIFGACHAGVAAYLLCLWGLPASIVEAVAFHHTPSSSDMRVLGPLAAVHIADMLEHEMSHAEAGGRPMELEAAYLTALKIDNARLDTWRAEAVKLLSAPEE